MKKEYYKLIATALSLVIAVVMVVTVSYAWLTISQSPAVNGIQVSIGGGNTILLAADMTKTVVDEDGNEILVHYPGNFGDSLVFSQYETYDYLNQVSPLAPVSTADGLNWVLPSYDESGELAPISAFKVDNTLSYANSSNAEKGSYVYLDFWIVSPGSEYDIHVSTDSKADNGSFLIELPEVTEDENTPGDLRLAEADGRTAAAARVGFLVNKKQESTESMYAYIASEGYDSRYRKLCGTYQEPGEALDLTALYQFTIYEPNGTLHPLMEEHNGAYIITNPLSADPFTKEIAEEDIRDIVTVQTESSWKLVEDKIQLAQIFQAGIAGLSNLTPASAKMQFYHNYLQNQVSEYVSSGYFFTNTEALYEGAGYQGVVSKETIETLKKAGATEDIAITTLERNTPQRIRMYIWLEGQDADCVNTSSLTSASFALSLELSGETK